MNINQQNHLLADTRYQPSPNADLRPPGTEPELIVIHNISLPPQEFGGKAIEQFFTNRLDASEHPYYATISDVRVSSHLLIRRDGNIIQFVPFDKRAWHAGESSYHGRSNCNDFSIGIELEGTDTLEYEEIQYKILADIILTLCQNYPKLHSDRVTGHQHISPGRKTDPGIAFDWVRLIAMLSDESGG